MTVQTFNNHLSSSPKTTHALVFRLVALSLALGFWSYYVGRKPFDVSGGWRYLTNWGLSLNLLAASWAMLGTWIPRFGRTNPVLPAALTVSSMVAILYWGLYIINPSMVNGNGGLPWYSEIYMHLGTTLFVYAEAFWLNTAPPNRSRALVPVTLLALAYMVWVDQLVAPHNTLPCGLTTNVCGYPYPFLNDFTDAGRLTLYAAAGLGTLALSTLILMIWERKNSSDTDLFISSPHDLRAS